MGQIHSFGIKLIFEVPKFPLFGRSLQMTAHFLYRPLSYDIIPNHIKALSSFIPGNRTDCRTDCHYILHDEIGGSIKIQKFEKSDQEYTTENMGDLACPTNSGDEQSCTSIDVQHVTRLDSSLFFLSQDHVSLSTD